MDLVGGEPVPLANKLDGLARWFYANGQEVIPIPNKICLYPSSLRALRSNLGFRIYDGLWPTIISQ
jgi:uncharacterized RDD family membrane protein YckC